MATILPDVAYGKYQADDLSSIKTIASRSHGPPWERTVFEALRRFIAAERLAIAFLRRA